MTQPYQSRQTWVSTKPPGPPNATVKRSGLRRVGGAALAGRAGAVGAGLAGASPSKDRDHRGAPEPRKWRATSTE